MAKNKNRNRHKTENVNTTRIFSAEEKKGTVLEKLIPLSEDTEAETVQNSEEEQVTQVQEINPLDQMTQEEKAKYIGESLIECLDQCTRELETMLTQYRIFDIRHGGHVAVKKSKDLLKLLLSQENSNEEEQK